MRLCSLTVLLVAAAVAARAEDCPLLLNQRFQLHFNQWQATQIPTTSTLQAVYEVDAGIPVFTYRLGALGLSGAVEYNKLAYGSESDSQTSLSRYGARLSLFPYRPFRLYFDFQHSQTPDLLGSGSVKGDVWGAGATYRSRLIQDLRLSYRHGSSRLEEQREDWSLWKLEANQQVGDTRARLESLRQEYVSPTGGANWRLFVASLDTDTHIGSEWMLRTRSQIQDTQSTRWFDLGGTFYGPVSGSLHSLTILSAGATMAGGVRTATTFGSESLVYSTGRWNLHTSGAVNQADTEALDQRTRVGTLASGATYRLTQDWRLHGDLGVSTVQQSLSALDSTRTTTTVNVGIARGGDVPELLRHTLFFFSDWGFDRRVREEYPPDYVPSELATEMIQRRMRQTGNFGFTADVWRMSDNVGQGHIDWARVTGQMHTRGDLALYVSGDYRNDDGMTLAGMSVRNSNLLANGSYRMGPSTLTASLGYSDTQNRIIPGFTVPPTVLLSATDAASRYYALGLNSTVAKVPFGFLALRYDSTMASSTTTFSTWADLNFRQLSVRLRYETSRMDTGFRSHRITVDLLRWFDTICVRNWR